jgi:hypothetical protein
MAVASPDAARADTPGVCAAYVASAAASSVRCELRPIADFISATGRDLPIVQDIAALAKASA